MSERPEVVFASLSAAPEQTVAVLCAKGTEFGKHAGRVDAETGGALRRAAEAASFEGKSKTSIELLGLGHSEIKRVVLVGCGKREEASAKDWTDLGGFAWAQLSNRKAASASLIVDAVEGAAAGETAARLAQGALLRSYQFRKYMTKKRDEEAGEPKPNGLQRLVIHTAAPDDAKVAFARLQAVADGVNLARDLVNEPPNALGPVEFAERMRELEALGVQVEILDAAQLEALKMHALLGVAQGSVRPARVVVMQWNGGKSKRQRPLCIVGKGVCFDSGGLSIKPAQGMEDMKGDMGGAACVAGLMHALAARKAPVSAVGLIGLVENLPSGTAQRPGDIVTSMSGQTIEVLNTDAEGRLVLADLLWYAQDRFKPRLIIDLATLTGAIMVALGKEYAGLFANDDKLASDLHEAGEATGERVWRMPLAKAYDKLIDSKTADMKNIGGRYAGAVTAAQFLQRFIKDTPWAHLDIAGVAMDSAKNEINQSWGSGWGVRLLDQLIADKHEKAEKTSPGAK